MESNKKDVLVWLVSQFNSKDDDGVIGAFANCDESSVREFIKRNYPNLDYDLLTIRKIPLSIFKTYKGVE